MIKNKNIIFLTGATGLVGSFLLKLLLENDYQVYALARSKDNQSAQDRAMEILKFWQADILDKINLKNLRIVEGEITEPDLGIGSKRTIQEITNEAEIIFHCAALARLRVPLEIIRKINVAGTKNVLDLSLKCKRLEKFNHISTAYVVGTKKNIDFSEDMLELGQGFNNTYEQTKYEAEILIKEYQNKGIRASIFRPSMVMGDSVEGKTNDFRLFYEPLHIFSQGIYQEFPANLKCLQNFINIDTVAKAIFLLGRAKVNGTYHIVSPENQTLEFLINVAQDYFGFKMPKFIPLENFDFKQLTPAQKVLAQPYIPYFNYNPRFLAERTQDALNKSNFQYPQIDKNNLLRIFDYCHKKGFIKKRKG